MFSKGRLKPGKNQIRGHQKPQMLAAAQRQLSRQKAAQKQKPKIALKDLAAHEPHININLGNMRLPILILLVVVLPQVLADTNIQRIFIEGLKVHGKPVALLPPEANCRRNPLGVSKGQICQFGGTTHYMKQLKPSETRKTRHLSYQVFNHQLAESTIGIKTAKISFFKAAPNDASIYIASEHVNDIKFIENRNGINKLKSSDTAKWAAASTFIYDLHTNNVGYTNEGIVALDLDGHNRPLTDDLFTNMMTSAHSINIHSPWLSLDDIKQMQVIYRDMQTKSLPEHHDSFHLTDKMYQDMLKEFISICDKVMAALESKAPEPEHSQPDAKVNQAWCEAVKDHIAWWERTDDKFYDALCVDKKPKAAKFGFINHAKDDDLQMKSKPRGAKFDFKKRQKDTEESDSSFSP